MAVTKTLTAPLAIISINGVKVGKMKDVRLTETMQRGRVSGIGQATPDELPMTMWSGTLSCSAYMVNFDESLIAGSLQRNVQSVEDFINTMLFTDGVQIDVLRKEVVSTNAAGVPTVQLVKFASIVGCLITREAFNISESQISGRDADFEYMNPVIFPV